jgi:hypothetical protein
MLWCADNPIIPNIMQQFNNRSISFCPIGNEIARNRDYRRAERIAFAKPDGTKIEFPGRIAARQGAGYNARGIFAAPTPTRIV